MSTKSNLLKDIVKFNNFTQSRDKIYRIVQYTSRLWLWHLERTGNVGDFQTWLKQLEVTLTTSRKLFRMATSLEFLQKAVDATALPDQVLIVTTIGGMAGKALWLLIDHLLWLGKVNLVDVDMKKWARRSSWLWLLGLVSLTIRDLRKLQLLYARAQNLRKSDHDSKETKIALKCEFHTARLTLVKDLCDVFIPLSSLDYLSRGIGACTGVISSFVGLKMEWEKNIRPYVGQYAKK